MEIYTIGFTKKRAAQFFGALRDAGVKQLVDVRLNNVSQLAGFTKRDDLEFFLSELCDAAYLHESLLAPTPRLSHFRSCVVGVRWRCRSYRLVVGGGVG